MRKMATAIVSILLLSPIQLFAQPKDGLYVVPSANLYTMNISNGHLAKVYTFNLDGFWTIGDGSIREGKIESSFIYAEGYEEIAIEENPLGATVKTLRCGTFFGHDEAELCDDPPPIQALEVLTATSDIKAVYRTQWGSDFVIFESNGVGIMLDFEYSTARANGSKAVWAATSTIDSGMTFKNPQVVVDSDNSVVSRNVTFDWSIEIEDLNSLQANFKNVSCKDKEGVVLDCEEDIKKYFTKLIRIF